MPPGVSQQTIVEISNMVSRKYPNAIILPHGSQVYGEGIGKTSGVLAGLWAVLAAIFRKRR